jgi:hypothetical protein
MSADDAVLAELSELLGLPLLSEEEQEAVLDLTRVVAHGVQRRFGPLTAYALGLAMSLRADEDGSDPADRTLRVRRAIEVLTTAQAEVGTDPSS